LLAESIAAGNTVISPALSSVLPSAAIHDALTHGFGILMLYGGMGVWLLAAISIFIFASPKRLLVTN
jgi:hypothetical protein